MLFFGLPLLRPACVVLHMCVHQIFELSAEKKVVFNRDKEIVQGNFFLKYSFYYAPNFEKVGSVLVSARPCVRPSVRADVRMSVKKIS